MKTKFLRPNNSPHTTKELKQTILERSRLKKLSNKTKDSEHVAAYKRQRNLDFNLNRQAKKSIFGNAKNKNFWKICKSHFSAKLGMTNDRTIHVKNGETISDSNNIAEIFNNYFNGLGLPSGEGIHADLLDPVSSAIIEYCIKYMKQRCRVTNSFEFSMVTEDMVKTEILLLTTNKKASGFIPIKVLKLAAGECAPALTK